MMSKKSALLCGPWVGEFSYEVHSWAPKLRYYVNNHYSEYHIVHFGFSGRELLYRDFIDEYISYDKYITDNIPAANSGGVGRGQEHSLETHLTEELLEKWISENKSKYQDMFILRPKELECITMSQVLNDHTDAEYIHLKPVEQIQNDVDNFLNTYKNNDDTISIMAPTPHETFPYRENWNPDSWVEFIDRVISKMNLNIAMVGIKSKDNLQGSYTFEDTFLYEKYPEKIKSYVLDSESNNSLDYQVQLLRDTKCSIWGSTGATMLAFFCEKPIYAHLLLGQLPRLTLNWQKELTGGHKDVKFIHKYKKGMELYNAPVDEFYNEFEKFYKNIGV